MKLRYRIENSSVATLQKEVEVEGQLGTFAVKRLLVEMVPVGHSGGTISFDLSPETEGYDEGLELDVSIPLPKKEA